MSWKELALLIILVPPMVLVAEFLAGSIIEGYGKDRARIEACQQRAVTPFDYFRC